MGFNSAFKGLISMRKNAVFVKTVMHMICLHEDNEVVRVCVCVFVCPQVPVV